MKQKVKYILTGLLVIICVYRAYQIFSQPEATDIRAEALMQPRVEGDRVFETLLGMGEAVTKFPEGIFWKYSADQRRALWEDNQTILRAYNKWLQEEGDPFVNDNEENRSRVPWPDMQDMEQPLPSILGYRTLFRLMILDVLVALEQERWEDALASLEQCYQLLDRLIYNPTLMAMMGSTVFYSDLAILLTHHIPDHMLNESHLDRLVVERLRSGFRKAIWLEAVVFSSYMQHLDHQLGDFSVMFLSFTGAFHEQATLAGLYWRYQWYAAQIDRPLGFFEQPAEESNNVLFDFNGFGKLFLSTATGPDYGEFCVKLGFVMAQLEVTRANLEARLNGREFDPRVMAEVINPLTGEPFVINEHGLADVIPADDAFKYRDILLRYDPWVVGLARPE